MFKTTAALTTNGDAQLLNETVQLSISAANIRYVDVIAGLHGCLCAPGITLVYAKVEVLLVSAGPFR